MKPKRPSPRRPPRPCHACYRPIAADESGDYCARCVESGAAARHLAARHPRIGE